jgi:hypothetical protein
MFPLKYWLSFPRMAQASMTTTFTAGPRGTFEFGFCRFTNARSLSAGLDLYATRLDKGYSMTDCISMQAMRREGLTDVLTNDRHFEQEGFRALFRN